MESMLKTVAASPSPAHAVQSGRTAPTASKAQGTNPLLSTQRLSHALRLLLKPNEEKSSAPVAGVTPALASIFASFTSFVPPSLALNYDDIVNDVRSASQAATSSASDAAGGINFDFDGATSGAVDFVTANPLALLAGFAAVTVPLIASRAIASTSQTFGSISAVDAYNKLSNKEENAQLLDVRALEDIKTEGAPDLKSLRKRAVQVPYAADDEGFVDRVLAKFKDAENTTVYILDRFDGSAAAVAKLLANSGFKGAYAIKGGAEGNNGWQKNELPWALPKKGFTLDIGNLKNIIGDGSGVGTDASSLVPTTLGVAAAAGVGLVVFSEVETALQLLGSAALIQLFVKKFLFAEDRKKTVKDIQTFLDTKIAPKGFVDELKEVGKVLLPRDDEVEAAVANGAAFLEEKLDVDSVTPETLVGKLEEKTGVELPKVEDVKRSAAELEEKAEATVEDVKRSAEQTEEKVEAKVEDVKRSVEQTEEKVEAKVEDVKSSAEEDARSVKAVAEQATVGVDPSAFQDAGIGEDIGAIKVEEAPATSVAARSSSTDLPKSPTPLSPFTKYPGLKPPTSPIPSRP